MATADEVGTKLIALSCATAWGTDIFIDQQPATPDVIVTVNNSGGGPSEFVFGSAVIDREMPALQIIFRGAEFDGDGPRATAQTAFEGLAQVVATTLTDTDTTSAFYHHIRPLHPPVMLVERDEKNRTTWVLNVDIEKELSA